MLACMLHVCVYVCAYMHACVLNMPAMVSVMSTSDDQHASRLACKLIVKTHPKLQKLCKHTVHSLIGPQTSP